MNVTEEWLEVLYKRDARIQELEKQVKDLEAQLYLKNQKFESREYPNILRFTLGAD